MTIPGIWAVDKFGRRSTLMFGGVEFLSLFLRLSLISSFHPLLTLFFRCNFRLWWLFVNSLYLSLGSLYLQVISLDNMLWLLLFAFILEVLHPLGWVWCSLELVLIRELTLSPRSFHSIGILGPNCLVSPCYLFTTGWTC